MTKIKIIDTETNKTREIDHGNHTIEYDEVMRQVDQYFRHPDYHVPFYKIKYKNGPSENPNGVMSSFVPVSIQKDMEFEVTNPRVGMKASELIDMLHILGKKGDVPCQVRLVRLCHKNVDNIKAHNSDKIFNADKNKFIINCTDNKFVINTNPPNTIPEANRKSLKKDIEDAINPDKGYCLHSEVCVDSPKGRIYGATILYHDSDQKDDLILLV